MDQNTLVAELVDDEPNTVNDKCPVCNTFTKDFKHIGMIPQVGWIECDVCGAVFCPESIRTMKRQGQSSIIVPPPGTKII